jgi:hypothetical protein
MSYAPADLLDIRDDLIVRLDLDANALGIVGDMAHIGGYHCGADRVTTRDYSVVESGRDRAGLSNAASALDIGDFDLVHAGRRIALRSLSAALVAACLSGDIRTRDVREVIYSPDGVTVARWDRLGVRSSGDSSHLWHTHISMFRDAEGRRGYVDNLGGLLTALVEGTVSTAPPTTKEGADMPILLKDASGSTIVLTDWTWTATPAWADVQALQAAGMPMAAVSSAMVAAALALPRPGAGATAITLTDAQAALIGDRIGDRIGAALAGHAGLTQDQAAAATEAGIRAALGSIG